GETQINSLLKDIVKTLEPSVHERQQTIQLSLSEIPMIDANHSELYRALINLVENAINYTPFGGTIHIKSGEDKENLYIEIIDNGIGISDDELPHIFERYYRA